MRRWTVFPFDKLIETTVPLPGPLELNDMQPTNQFELVSEFQFLIPKIQLYNTKKIIIHYKYRNRDFADPNR